MSITEPTSRRAAGEAPPAPSAPLLRGERLRARAEALATRRNGLLLLAGGALVLLAIFAVRPTYPNYDSYTTLLWGRELASGHLPDYAVYRPPTPHPLATLVAALVTRLGPIADRVYVLIGLASFLALLATLFRLTQRLLGTLIAIVALAWLLTRTDVEFFAMRAMVDVPFLALVFGAAVLELARPRRGAAVLALLGLAGLLRPEAWVLSGLYWLWLLPALRGDPRRLAGYAALAAAAPVLWFASDLLVTGRPLYSLTSTREVAGEFGRQRGLLAAIGLVPDYVGGNEKIVTVVAGGLGGVLALWLLRRRAVLPLALVGIGLGVFLAIAAAGLSVIPRYLLIPSLVFDLCVGVAFAGWALTHARGPRRAAIALAVLSLLLLGWRTPALVNDARKLNGQTHYVMQQHQGLKAILSDARVVALLGRCGPITVPTHSAIPVIRYATGLPKTAFVASIAQRRPPDRGLLLLANDFNFEPGSSHSTTGAPSKSARRWWSNYPLSTFRRVAGNATWRVYARCPAPPA